MKKESSNNSAYIVSSFYDKILFITAPLIAVAIAVIGYTTDTLLTDIENWDDIENESVSINSIFSDLIKNLKKLFNKWY